MRLVKCTGMTIGLIVLLVATGLGNGGTFVTRQIFNMDQGLWRLQTADLDGDGNYDLAAPAGEDILIYWNRGDGTLDNPVPYASLPGSSNLHCVDLNRDGNIDIACLYYASGTTYVLTILNNGNRTFQTPVAYSMPELHRELYAIDLNGDDYPEIITPESQGLTAAVLNNRGDGTFHEPIYIQICSDAMEMHYGISGGDLDADGDNDLVLPADYGSPRRPDSVRVLLNKGDGTFASPVGYEAGLFPRDPAVIDLDNDGDLDLVAASQMTLNIVILLNNGDATFETHTSGWLASNTRYLDAADLDNDGDADIAAVGWDDDVIAYYYNNGDGTFAEPVINSLGSDPGEVVLADFDLDGDHDVAYMMPTQLIVLQNQTVSCCGRYTGGYTGNTDCSTDGKRTLNDITVLIDNVFILHGELCCPGNSNADGSTDGKTTLNDITRLIDNVFISHSETEPCP